MVRGFNFFKTCMPIFEDSETGSKFATRQVTLSLVRSAEAPCSTFSSRDLSSLFSPCFPTHNCNGLLFFFKLQLHTCGDSGFVLAPLNPHHRVPGAIPLPEAGRLCLKAEVVAVAVSTLNQTRRSQESDDLSCVHRTKLPRVYSHFLACVHLCVTPPPK